MTKPFQWIDDTQALANICFDISKKTTFSIDTECVRERTYYPVLSLVQIATENDVFLIDLTAISDYNPLCRLLSNKKITKIIHAAGQDHHILYHLGCTMESPTFDTQIAAAFLNMGPQISYKSLIKECLNIDLDKDCARSNWLQRPLSSKQQEYAANDVIHLLKVHQILHDRLVQENKLTWFNEESERILQKTKHTLAQPPDAMSIKVSGSGPLTRVSERSKLQALIVWREYKAQQLDKPRRWLLPDDTLIKLAQRNLSLSQIEKAIKTCPNRHIQEWSKEIAGILAGISDDDTQVRKTGPSQQQKNQVEKILSAIRKSAEEHNIATSLITNRKQITRLVLKSDAEIHELLNSGWRKTVTRNHLPAL